MAQYIYAASHDVEGCIARFTLSEEGKLTLIDRYPIDRPAFLCTEGSRMYAVLREPFMMQSGVASFAIQPDGSLEQLGPIRPAHGTVAAHVLSWKGRVYTANYLTGTTTLLPGKLLAHNGSSVHPTRQDCSHPHCLTVTPDGKYLCINDLGTDCIYVCTLDLEEVSWVQTPPGSGPRHLVFSPDGKFAFGSNELDSTVSVFAYHEGTLTHLAACSTVPDDHAGENYPAAIRVSADGKTLYVSNRGHDSVCMFDVEDGVLNGKRFLPSGGRSPREMNLVGDFLLCGNEGSGTITVTSLKTGVQTDSVPLVRPWCILPVEV